MFLEFARKVSSFVGHPTIFIISLISIIMWLIIGPYFDYSVNWQLSINSSTTILTFLIVIILQHSSNHDAEQLDKKLNQIIALLHAKDLSKEEKQILLEHHEEFVEEAIAEAQEAIEESKND